MPIRFQLVKDLPVVYGPLRRLVIPYANPWDKKEKPSSPAKDAIEVMKLADYHLEKQIRKRGPKKITVEIPTKHLTQASIHLAITSLRMMYVGSSNQEWILTYKGARGKLIITLTPPRVR